MTLRKPWDFSGGIERIWFGGLSLLIIMAPAMTHGGQDPHAFMDDPSQCLHCHDTMPVRPGGLFTKDIVNLCRDCHIMVHRMSHPVDIRPQEGVPPELPLDSEGTMTCSTCHDPHSDQFSKKPFVNRGVAGRLKGLLSSADYPTYFLRMPNTVGQLCLSCHESEEINLGHLDVPPEVERDYTGSKACDRCHGDIFREWKKTPHARTLQDPRENPRAVKAIFSGSESFKPEDVEIVIGVHWNQRYVIDRGGDLKIARGVWSLGESTWTRSFWREHSWKDYCAGCHLTGYDPYEDSYVEKGVGCEMCHGPGGNHVRSGKNGDIVNPANIERSLAISICASCHTNGHDRTGQFRYPVGYLPGQDLDLYYRGLLPHFGQDEDTFKGDGTLEDRLRSFVFWLEQFYRPSRVVCKQCKSLHTLFSKRKAAVGVDLTLAQYCLSCHEGLHEDPKHSLKSGKDMNCHSCHMPLTDSLERPSIHDHKYAFDGFAESHQGAPGAAPGSMTKAPGNGARIDD
jgi:hypothetical protein